MAKKRKNNNYDTTITTNNEERDSNNREEDTNTQGVSSDQYSDGNNAGISNSTVDSVYADDSYSADDDNEDVYRLFIFYPNGIDNTESDQIYKLTDAELALDMSFSDKEQSINKICGRLKTTYFFPDTHIGDMRTWRFRFYDVVIKNIHIDSLSDFILYDIEADGFDVNQGN
jgi:hypothetical protein